MLATISFSHNVFKSYLLLGKGLRPWEREKMLVNNNFSYTNNVFYYVKNFCKPFPQQDLVFMCLQYKSFENNVGKGEIAGNE